MGRAGEPAGLALATGVTSADEILAKAVRKPRANSESGHEGPAVDLITWDPEKDRLNRAKHGIGVAESRARTARGARRESGARPASYGLGGTTSRNSCRMPESPFIS